MTRILVLEEEHGNRYFDATTDEQLHKAALFVLRSRFDEGCWYPDPEPPEALDFTEADIEKAPASMRDEMKRIWKSHQKEVWNYEEEKEDHDNIDNALSTNDGKAAIRILRNRDGYEYEGCKIEECEEVE
jgi:hypothetical protein